MLSSISKHEIRPVKLKEKQTVWTVEINAVSPLKTQSSDLSTFKITLRAAHSYDPDWLLRATSTNPIMTFKNKPKKNKSPLENIRYTLYQHMLIPH